MQNKALFAAGCFWSIEHYFQNLNGVYKAVSGYAGGNTQNPTYRQVCSGETGHAEAVEISFNPNIISFETLLQHFWTCHDPTQINKQGYDIGTQYRSAIFPYDEAQRETAIAAKENAQKNFQKPIATEITPFTNFYPAEEYHQQYIRKNRLKACSP